MAGVEEEAVRAAVCATLVGLEPDLLDFVVGGLVDAAEDAWPLERDACVELVAPYLEELCGGDAEQAEAKATELWGALGGGGGGGGSGGAKEPQKLREAIRIGGGGESESSAAADDKPEAPVVDDSKARAKAAKAAARQERDRERDRAAAAADALQLAEELERCRVAAAELRAVEGAGRLGSVTLAPFTLPNPGGGANLLENASAVLTPGHRYGLIGRNGKGKSTLLKALAARRVGDLPARLSVHYVSQDVTLTAEQEDWLPGQVVLEADVERRVLLAEAAALREADTDAAAVQRLSQVEERLDAIGAGGAEERADQLLVNLGFSAELRRRPMRALSGGWRVRTSLAAALFAKPDLLLLDEPTNHLSIDAVLWLAREIGTGATWDSRIVVTVSHDRFFLDESCSHVLHISGVARRLTQTKGSYGTWCTRRADQQKTWKRTAELRAQKREKLREYTAHGFKYGGSSAQIAQQQKKLKEIAKLDDEAENEAEELAALEEDAELPLTLSAGGVLDKPAIQLQGVGFAYPGGKPLFEGVDLTVDSRSRVVLLGENGAGKTTLVKVMVGELEPTSGLVSRAGGARVEIVTQHHADQLDLDSTPLQFMAARFPGDGSLDHEQSLRSHLAQCGVDATLQGTVARGLSGGQRARVAMASVSFARPHVLVLDEPTNNLDLEAVAALADCVQRFEGGVVLVSHDTAFVTAVARDVLVVGDGTVRRVESFAAYKKKAIARLDAASHGPSRG